MLPQTCCRYPVRFQCSLMYHQVEMDAKREKALADLRGKYSIMTRRFTELTNSWQPAAANTPVVLTQYQPQGAVTELILIAVPDTGEEQADPSRCGNNYVLPINFKITADSVVQKDLNTPEKVKAELWTNGFVAPVDFPVPGVCALRPTPDPVIMCSPGHTR